MNAIVPVPRYAIAIRTAALSDLPFIDSLQRIHSKQVGWMPKMQLEEKIRRGNVVIAEERHEGTETRRRARISRPHYKKAFLKMDHLPVRSQETNAPPCLRVSSECTHSRVVNPS